MKISKRLAFFSAVVILILIWISSIYSVHSNFRVINAEIVKNNRIGINVTFSLVNKGLYPLYVSAKLSAYSSDSGENLGNFLIIFGFVKMRSGRNQTIFLDVKPVSEMDLLMEVSYEAKLFFLPGLRIPLRKSFHVSLKG